MSLWRLIKRSLIFYWRTNIGILLSVLVGTAILVGALAVGDCVHYSLKMMVNKRLGTVDYALILRDKFFRDKLADELAAELHTTVAPLLHRRGLIANSSGTRHVNRIEILGVDERFYKIGAVKNPLDSNWADGVILNKPLAVRLAASVGDEVVLRIEKPGLMPREVPLSPDFDLSTAFRRTVKAIATDSEFGHFSLQANQVAPMNAFVPIQWLQEKLGRSAQANMMLMASSPPNSITVEKADEDIKKCWQLGDIGLELRKLDRQNALEIRSKRVFINDSLAEAAMRADGNAVGILTYFVNELRLNDKATPYSMITAMGPSAGTSGFIPMDMRDDEIIISRWLADDLEARVGDLLELTYFVLGPMRTLVEQKSQFRVRQILHKDSPAIDPELMPDFPGLADVDNCRDWKPGVPIELGKIRTSDEDYWRRYRGSPKAFVTLKAGQAMWSNRYGSITAIRYKQGRVSEQDITTVLLNAVEPASVGLFFQPVRQRGEKASDQATNFGQLFLGFSMFLIIAAAVLMALVFVFGVESRTQQVGLLLAVGFSPKLVRRLFFMEGAILAALGAIAGTAAGLFYTKAMIYGLATGWQILVSGSPIHFYVKPATMFVGALGAAAISLLTIWMTVRHQVSRPAHQLLAGIPQWQFFGGTAILAVSSLHGLEARATQPLSKGKIGLWVTVVAVVGAVLLFGIVGTTDSESVSAIFFGVGALLLIAGLGLSQTLLRLIRSGWNRPMVSLIGLGLRNSTRRSGRSLAVVGLLACGIFLVIAVGANRHDTLTDTQERDSGTGGFMLFGESTIGVLQDLNSKSVRQSMGLDDSALEGVKILQLRVRDGDDASCFNLNRAQTPRLLGVQPARMQERGAFKFVEAIKDNKQADRWKLLDNNYGEDVVPAIGDYATIIWALGRSIGDELEYTDDEGQKFRLRLVGILKNSILQGTLIISEDQFIKRFPSESGYRMFLIDAPQDKTDVVTEKLSTALRDYGLELTDAKQRLAEFSAIENTYLSVFAILGGLGLILGSMGLGVLVLRNILERRGELAMLQAVGFRKRGLKQLVFYEHWFLVLGGLTCGIVAALVAIVPAIKSPATEIPYFSLILTIIAIAVSGVIWIWMATVFALGGKMLEALRNE